MLRETELLGKKVTFCRLKANPQTGELERHEGVGTAVKVYLSEDRRIQVGVQVGKDIYGIDYPAINATEEGKAKYYAHCAAIYSISDDYNARVRELTTKGNGEINALNNTYLGVPLEIEPIDEVVVREPYEAPKVNGFRRVLPFFRKRG